jgi:hypothetical protein
MGCNSTKLPLLLERVGERRIKSTGYIPPHPSLLPQGIGIYTSIKHNKNIRLYHGLTPSPIGRGLG